MAQQHPLFPQEPAGNAEIKHIFPLIALEADAAHSRVLGLLKSEYSRSRYKENDRTKALALALVALSDRAREHFRGAQRQGELLLCWHGTKCTTVPFEVPHAGGVA